MAARMGWDLRAQVHGDPLALARARILYDESLPLDDDGERFLAKHFEKFHAEDLLVWLSRRGSAPQQELPEGAVPSSRIAKAFLAKWKTEDGFRMVDHGQGICHEGAALYRIDSDVWGEIAETMLERVQSVPDPEIRRRMQWGLVRSLRGCEVYESLRSVKNVPWPPDEVRSHPDTTPWLDAHLALVRDRRDPKACLRILVERAQRGTVDGDLEPLWVFDRLQLLEGVDPREVLPAQTSFPFHRETRVDEALSPEEDTAKVVCGEYPVALALRWPGPKGPLAEAWLRDILVEENASAHPPRLMATYLFGGEVGSHDSTARRAVARWLQSPAVFDALMRASIDAAAPMPLAWVTAVRDLRAGAKGAWTRALSWIARTLDDATAHPKAESSRHLSFDLTCLFNEIPEWVRALGGEPGPLSAMRWIVFDAPLGDDINDGLASTIELAMLRLVAWEKTALRQTPHPLIDPWNRRVWCRVASMPMTTARRTRLIELLKGDPGLVQAQEVREKLERLAPFSRDEVPPFACHLFDPDEENIRATLQWFVRFGGDGRLDQIVEWFDRLNSAPDGFEPLAFVVLEVCAANRNDDWRRRVLASFAARPLGWITHSRERVASALGLPLDLASIARGRLHGQESFTALPDEPEFAPLLAERLIFLATSQSPKCRGLDGCEVLGIARRLDPAVLRTEPIRGALRDRVGVDHEFHAIEILDLLAGAGEPRSSLFALALECVARFEGESSHLLATNDAAAWLARRMTTRSAWERDGDNVSTRLLDAAPWALERLARRANDLAQSNQNEKEVRTVCDAILLTLARVFAGRAKESIEQRDEAHAKALLLALMELDAPSFAMRFIRPLRKLVGADGELASVLSACEQQLRHDTGRVSSPDNVARALFALDRRTRSQPSAADA